MVPDISHLMAAINPDVFCEPRTRKAVRKQLRQGLADGDRLAYFKAAQLALPREPNEVMLEELENISHFDLPGQRCPVEQHTLVLDYAEEPLEPIYFNLLDELQSHDGWVVEKLVDTVSATHGSGLSMDLGRRIGMQQQEVSRLLALVHRQARVLLAQWQKWREQKRQVALYDQARSEDAAARQAALHQLKHKWRRESENISAVPDSSSEDDAAFNAWLTHSEAELRQRLEVDRGLLSNELNLLKLQVDWVRPHLKPVQDSRRWGDPALVSAFNTAIFDVVLLVAPLSDLEQAVQAGDLPETVLNPRYRRSWPILIVSLRFRAVPERSSRGAYGYRGRAEMTFTSYALNREELVVFRRELQRSQWGEVFGLLEQATATKLDALLNDLDELLAEKPSTPSQPVPISEDTNPFSALFSCWELFTSSPSQSEAEEPVEPLRPDNGIERAVRSFALIEARVWCRELYEQQKRLRRMPSWET